MVGDTLKTLLTIAWLLPLFGFAIEMLWGRKGDRTTTKWPAWMAVGCIATGFLCSFAALMTWGSATKWAVLESHDEHETHEEHDAHDHGDAAHEEEHASFAQPAWQLTAATADEEHAAGAGHHSDEHEGTQEDGEAAPLVYHGTLYTLATFGDLKVSIDYYIDSLTLVMFTMVTLIATCIHLFAIGYMSDELTDEYVDHFAHTSDGKHVHRQGRFYRFFAFLSLFCFSMLGLVLAGNIFQVFVFWELVGICSFLLIGFYTERKSASNAANKAFIMNRVGDFGFLIGLMVVWTWFGTFQFSELFETLPRDGSGNVVVNEFDEVSITAHGGEQKQIPYSLLVVAGLGVFAGCIGKSAQFPLQTWLPDAMEGPTPVSALVHSATMVAAGVYLVGRFYPMFVPEVLLTIAYIGAITLFVAATIAVVATDIKKVLAYSTISQLGYMMLGLGVFGWAAGLFHLITHAFFKSLMFLCSGSVIHGCHHEQEMPKMGGLLKKMPITALTMLVGVIAISGLAIPGSAGVLNYLFTNESAVIELANADADSTAKIINAEGSVGIAEMLQDTQLHSAHGLHDALDDLDAAENSAEEQAATDVLDSQVTAAVAELQALKEDDKGLDHVVASLRFLPITFSGFHSKDAIVATSLAFTHGNPSHFLLFLLPLLTAGITAFYMFRLWFYTFWGQPRDQHVYDHAHESPWIMTVPLLVLSVFAAFCAIGGERGFLFSMLLGSEPSHVAAGVPAATAEALTLPSHHAVHDVHAMAGTYALVAAIVGTLLAYVLYGTRTVNLDDMKRQLSGIHQFLSEKWYFDELYDALFMKPMHKVAALFAWIDRTIIDSILHGSAKLVQLVAKWDRVFDETLIDGLVNLIGRATFSAGTSLKVVQTGRLRQYVMFIVVGVVALFAVLFTTFPN